MKKLVAYLNNFQRKKLFCVQTLTKLPELTVVNKAYCIIHTYIGIYMRIFYVHGWYIKLPMYLLFIWALYSVVLRGDYP